MPDPAAKSPSPDREERRHTGRSRALLGATIVFRDGTGTISCVVRNRAEDGTQLEIPPNQLVPKRFYLITARDNQVYEAELVWKKGNRIGVALGKTIDPSAANAKALHFLNAHKPGNATGGPDPNRKSWDDDRWPV